MASGTGKAEVVEEGVPSNFFTSCEQMHDLNYDLVSKNLEIYIFSEINSFQK